MKCRYTFCNKRRKRTSKKLWKRYTKGKQTYAELAGQEGKSKRTIQRRLDESVVSKKQQRGTETVIIGDVTWIAEGCGLMLFRCAWTKKNLLWKYVEKETVDGYREGIVELIGGGWKVVGLVCDGKPGMMKSFPEIPTQMCQFHMVQIVTRYLTKRPKLEAGRGLRTLTLLLKQTDRASFTFWLEQWHEKWKTFLQEKTKSPETGRWYFTHKRLRSAYRSLQAHLPNLFVFEDHPHLNIPNTTNSLDGFFSHLKSLIRIHRGLKLDRKKKLIDELL